jgi:outer membrane lipoprotein-sorting protein
MKTRSLAITLLCFLPAAAGAQTADEIVKKAIEARGGAAKLKAVQSERVTGRIVFAPGQEGAFVVELKRPLRMHMEISVEGQTITRVFDGKSTGWMINPFDQNKGVQPMPAEDLKNITDESDFDGPLVDYQAKGNQIELIGKEVLDDKPVYRLKLTNKSGDTRFYLFDAATFILRKWEGTRKTGTREVPWESYFSEYREVQGLKYAFRIDQGSPGTGDKQTLITEKIEIDPALDDSRFAKPTPAEVSSPQASLVPRASTSE